MLAADGTGYWKLSTNGGSSWNTLPSPVNGTNSVQGCAMSYTGQYMIVGYGSSGGVYFSNDYGSSWSLITNSTSYTGPGSYTNMSMSANGAYALCNNSSKSTYYIMIGLTSKYILNSLSSSGKSGITGAFAVKLVNSSYTGPCMNIKRSSDSSTQDFYADSDGNLGTSYLAGGTSLTNWLGGSTYAYVTKWYDQSGYGNHASQSSSSYYPVYNTTSKLIDFSTPNTYAYLQATAGTLFNAGNTNYTITYKHGTLYSGSWPAAIVCGTGSSTDNASYILVGHQQSTFYPIWLGNSDFSPSYTYSANSTVSIKYLTTQAVYAYYNKSRSTSTISLAKASVVGTYDYIGRGADTLSQQSTWTFRGQLYYIYFAPSTGLSYSDMTILENT
jgi:hypothetical protein